MLIVVNHLTRMKPGYFCVAGISKGKDCHVRPVFRSSPLSVDLLAPNGGPFDMATIVELGEASYAGSAPETEDHIFHPQNAHLVRKVKPDEFWKLINRYSQPDLADIFGPELKQHEQIKKSCVVDCEKGNTSLGCLMSPNRLRLYINNLGNIRISFNESRFSVDLSVTDLRLYEPDLKTPRKKLVGQVAKRIRSGVSTVLSVGLTRPWQREGDSEKYHWLQINNIHLEDDPAWRLA